jgi:hypothetical protein
MVAGEEAKRRDRNCAEQLPHLVVGELAFSARSNDLATTLLLLSVVFWSLEADLVPSIGVPGSCRRVSRWS